MKLYFNNNINNTDQDGFRKKAKIIKIKLKEINKEVTMISMLEVIEFRPHKWIALFTKLIKKYFLTYISFSSSAIFKKFN